MIILLFGKGNTFRVMERNDFVRFHRSPKFYHGMPHYIENSQGVKDMLKFVSFVLVITFYDGVWEWELVCCGG